VVLFIFNALNVYFRSEAEETPYYSPFLNKKSNSFPL